MDAKFKTVWVSDVHLGSRACRVQLLLDFLRQTRCETLSSSATGSQTVLAPVVQPLRDAA